MSSRFGSCTNGRMDPALLRRGVTLCAFSTRLPSIRQMLYGGLTDWLNLQGQLGHSEVVSESSFDPHWRLDLLRLLNICLVL